MARWHAWTARRRHLATGVLVLVAAGTMTWILWPAGHTTPAARERHYRTTTACLLTDEHGLGGKDAKAAWAGMQQASTATLIKVQYLQITGPQTTANASTFFNTLNVQHCTVIIAAGPLPVAAMATGYQKFPGVQQIAIDGDTAGTPLHTIDASTPTTIQDNIRTIVAGAA